MCAAVMRCASAQPVLRSAGVTPSIARHVVIIMADRQGVSAMSLAMPVQHSASGVIWIFRKLLTLIIAGTNCSSTRSDRPARLLPGPRFFHNWTCKASCPAIQCR